MHLASRVWLWSSLAVMAALGTACFVSGDAGGESAPQAASSPPSSALGAVVALEGGCTATKVGPKHLLVAARCVANKPGFAIGKSVRFTKGEVRIATDVTAADAGPDVTVAALDASDLTASDASVDGSMANVADGGDADAAAVDAGVEATPEASAQEASAQEEGVFQEKIAAIKIHPSYLRTCGGGACRRGAAGAAEVADIALIVFSREIVDVPVAPIDLDPVPSDAAVLVLGNGCEAGASRLRASLTKAAPIEAVNHEGSPYTTESSAALAQSYVITRGPADVAGANPFGICSERDLGAPMFLANGTAVVGVNSNTTSKGAAPLPTTNQHARVDAFARHGVGAWLEAAGATTMRSCREDCAPLPAGGASTLGDAGADAASTRPDPLAEPEIGAEQESEPREPEGAPSEAAAPAAEKAPAATSMACSSGPPGIPGSHPRWFALSALALLVLLRRRK